MRSFSFVTLLLVASAILFLKPIATHAQVHKSHRTQTELVVLHYEKLVANGSLLTPEGWERSATLFDRSNPYPPDSEIFLMSTGELVGENWVKGDRAQVGTKWNDAYGTIDATLRYWPATPSGDVLPMAQFYSLVFIRNDSAIGNGNEASGIIATGEWKIEGPQRTRAATLEQAILYLTRKREESSDRVLRKHAASSIAALRRLSRNRGRDCAC